MRRGEISSCRRLAEVLFIVHDAPGIKPEALCRVVAGLSDYRIGQSSADNSDDSAVALMQAREAAMQGIEALYSLRNASVVRHFLRDHPEVIECLIEARPYLAEHFGPDARASLEVVSDPETADERQLFANIATGLPVDEAVKRLDAFDEAWFLHHVDRVAGLLNFNLEFA